MPNPAKPRSISESVRGYIKGKYQLTCCNCGGSTTDFNIGPDGQSWNIDHHLPIAYGGTNSIENLRLLCHSCNMTKGWWVPSDVAHLAVEPDYVTASHPPPVSDVIAEEKPYDYHDDPHYKDFLAALARLVLNAVREGRLPALHSHKDVPA